MRYTSQKGGDERFEQLEVCHPASTGAEHALCGPYPLVAVVGGEPVVAWAGGCPLCKRWQNITINGLSEQVRALNVGLDRVEGTLRFTGDLDTVNHVVDDDEDAGDAIEVPVRTLDAVLDDVRPVVFQLWISRLASTRITGAAPVRDQVGGDWGNYLRHFDQISYLSLREVLNLVDPGYYLVNWAASQIGAGIWLVNLFCAGVFTAGLIRFVRRLPDPMLALTVAVPYMITVVAMGYTRQAATPSGTCSISACHWPSIFGPKASMSC